MILRIWPATSSRQPRVDELGGSPFFIVLPLKAIACFLTIGKCIGDFTTETHCFREERLFRLIRTLLLPEVCPIEQCAQSRTECLSQAGQLIFNFRGNLRVDCALHDAITFQAA